MSMNVTSSAASSIQNVNSPAQLDTTVKTSDSSFKDEMKKATQPNDEGSKEVSEKDSVVKDSKESEKISQNEVTDSKTDNSYNASIEQEQQVAVEAMENANSLLFNDIRQITQVNTSENADFNLNRGICSLSIFGSDNNSENTNFVINENDAKFFINLTKTGDVSIQNITAQAQTMFDLGANKEQVEKSSQISKTLLDALVQSRENNQPIRIDFDKNIAVILRVNREGVIAAQFIPGDKAVEQYLKENLNSLKSTFEENDLPYTDLSYSHSSKEQNQRRRNEQQGE